MYSLKNLLKQEPAVVAGVLQAVLAVAVIAGWVDLSAEVVAGVAGSVAMLLGLFYVRPSVTPTESVESGRG